MWLLFDCVEVHIKHIYRENNFLADFLANKGNNLRFSLHTIDHSNPVMAHWIAYDLATIFFITF
ncbi:hypothetical protein LINPERPRIM_LOCUS23146 [Linum perenne]